MPPKRKLQAKAPEQIEGSRKLETRSAAKKPEPDVIEKEVKPTATSRSKKKAELTKNNSEPEEPPKKIKKAAPKKTPIEDAVTENGDSKQSKGKAKKVDEQGDGKLAKKKTVTAKNTTKKAAVKKDHDEPEEDEETPEIEVKQTTKRGAKKTKENDENDELDEEDVKEIPKKGVKKNKLNKENDESEEEEQDVKEVSKRGAKKTKESKKKENDQAEDEEQEVPKRGGKKAKEEPKKEAANKTDSDWTNLDFSCTKTNLNGDTFNLKISSWNVGGLKAWVKKGCQKFIEYENPDIMCLQETKCNEDNVPQEIKELSGYNKYWCGSSKDGYAGVGLLTKNTPIKVSYGINDIEMDEDGRCITAEFENYYIVGVYVPNAGRKLVTLPKRLDWNEKFKRYVKSLDEEKPVIICGDMNVSHNEIDLARPKNNTRNAGFTEEERQGFSEFLDDGYVDTFRNLYPDQEGQYTFWTYMANSRSKNVGWRLDYFVVSNRIMKNVCDNVIRTGIFGSDHCPITLFLNI